MVEEFEEVRDAYEFFVRQDSLLQGYHKAEKYLTEKLGKVHTITIEFRLNYIIPQDKIMKDAQNKWIEVMDRYYTFDYNTLKYIPK